MSNYVKATNFTAKDSLPSGNAGKIVKGAEIDTELTAIASAISSKADLNSPALTGTPTAPTATTATNTTQVATTAFTQAVVTNERDTTATITNKTINLTSNTLSGTIAQFNTALSDGNFATLTGSETLTNKTLTSPTLTSASLSSPTLTGTPIAPTASAGTNTTQVATTAFVQTATTTLVPTGIISLWYGSIATIPTGWALCNGSNGTPDLRNRFVIGAHSDATGVANTTITGSSTLTGGTKDAIIVSHTHTATVADAGHTHGLGNTTSTSDSGNITSFTGPGSSSVYRNINTLTGTTNSAVTGITVSNSTEGSSGTNANLPPYYALAYIMKL
jgi:hypothetical protein